MIKEVIKSRIKQLLKIADEDEEIEFLDIFGSLRKEVVFQAKIVTDEEFDDICQEVLKEI